MSIWKGIVDVLSSVGDIYCSIGDLITGDYPKAKKIDWDKFQPKKNDWKEKHMWQTVKKSTPKWIVIEGEGSPEYALNLDLVTHVKRDKGVTTVYFTAGQTEVPNAVFDTLSKTIKECGKTEEF